MGRRAGRRGGRRGVAGWRAAVRITAVGAALCASSAALPGPAAVAAPDDVTSYAFSDDVRTVQAATGTTGAAGLEPGATYRSSLSLPSPTASEGQSPDDRDRDRDRDKDRGARRGRGRQGLLPARTR